MPAAGPQATHRKTLAVKHQDGEPLTRVDLQYDLLTYLFTDPNAVFTDPYPTIHGAPAGSKVNFRNLYVNTLLHSPRCSKVSREKLLESPDFANEFAKIALLSNVGRINTTMAFFPEMRTALRTYHPVPSLQKTDGNLQDAPRIKNILKSCLLPADLQETLATPSDILNRSRSANTPPTTIVNLIFILTGHSSLIAQVHFPPNTSLELLDFFSPVPVSSASRARAFLWLCYHYYEGSSLPNPFDDYSGKPTGQIPRLELLSEEQARLENVDTLEEVEWGRKMTAQRKTFMENKDKPQEDTGEESSKTTKAGRGKGRTRGRRTKPKETRPLSTTEPLSLRTAESSPGKPPPQHTYDDMSVSPEARPMFSSENTLPPLRRTHSSPPISPRYSPEHPYRNSAHLPRLFLEPYPRRILPPSPPDLSSSGAGPIRSNGRGVRLPPLRDIAGFDAPLPPRPLPPLTAPFSARNRDPAYTVPRYVPPPPRLPNYPAPLQGGTRNMLEQAWHAVQNTDPLDESDDESDEHARLDLLVRLRIISRLRGKDPTPEPEARRPMQYAH